MVVVAAAAVAVAVAVFACGGGGVLENREGYCSAPITFLT